MVKRDMKKYKVNFGKSYVLPIALCDFVLEESRGSIFVGFKYRRYGDEKLPEEGGWINLKLSEYNHTTKRLGHNICDLEAYFSKTHVKWAKKLCRNSSPFFIPCNKFIIRGEKVDEGLVEKFKERVKELRW